MLTEKDYCDYETCVALEELGFPIRRIIVKGEEKHVPILLYEAQKWLREEKKIGVFVSGFKNGYTFWVYNLLIGYILYQGFFDNQTGEKYKSYEEALSEGVRTSIKILQDEQKENN